MALMVALGALVGAPARYLVDRTVQARHPTAFPWGTLTVNVLACLVFGLVTGIGTHLDPYVATLLGAGFCASLSTYSTFSYETMELAGQSASGGRFYQVANVAVSLIAGIGAAAVGWSVGLAIVA